MLLGFILIFNSMQPIKNNKKNKNISKENNARYSQDHPKYVQDISRMFRDIIKNILNKNLICKHKFNMRTFNYVRYLI